MILSNNKLKIEKISEKNFDDFFNLIIKLATYEKIEIPDAQAKVRLKRDGLSANPKYEGYLGIFNNTAIGYLIFFMNYSSFLALPTLYIEDIFLLEEYRRKGFGQALFNFSIQEAKSRGCGRVEWCVLTWNEPAIKFYEKLNATRLDWYFYRVRQEEFAKFG